MQSTYDINCEDGEVRTVTNNELLELLKTSDDVDSILKDLYCQECLFSFWVNNDTNIPFEKITEIHDSMKTVNSVYFQNVLLCQLGNGEVTIANEIDSISQSLFDFVNRKAKYLCCSEQLLIIADEFELHVYNNNSFNEAVGFYSLNYGSIKNIQCTDEAICFHLKNKTVICFFSGSKRVIEEDVLKLFTDNNRIVVKNTVGTFRYFFNNKFRELYTDIEEIAFSKTFIAGIHREKGVVIIPTENVELSTSTLFANLGNKIKSISCCEGKISVITNEGIYFSFDLITEKTFEIAEERYNFTKVLCGKYFDIALENDEIYILGKTVVKMDHEAEKFNENAKFSQIKTLLKPPFLLDYFINDHLVNIRRSFYLNIIYTTDEIMSFYGC